ncbi:hypothetical protein KIN20_010460 [Parelaphostrongylus tenuis]|uniref:Uncharacterized protein n=1 Tax=Parelaphostrongylus tenuis TaxID=148309 RepID=A0AAD5MBK6_PARTN|nr:hypothetical protein KIN20_010460 [Parelaphostrongylus tenuis]
MTMSNRTSKNIQSRDFSLKLASLLSKRATHSVSSLEEISESCTAKLLSDEIRVQKTIMDNAVLELEQMKITLDKREMLLESEQRTLFDLQEENEKLKRSRSLKSLFKIDMSEAYVASAIPPASSVATRATLNTTLQQGWKDVLVMARHRVISPLFFS